MTPHPAPVIRLCPGGCIVPVRAQPKAGRNALTGVHAGRYKIAVNAPPDKGKANAALLETLAAALNFPVSALEIVGGLRGRNKDVLVRGASDPAAIAAALKR